MAHAYPIVLYEKFKVVPHEHCGVPVCEGDILIAFLRLLSAVQQHIILVGLSPVAKGENCI